MRVKILVVFCCLRAVAGTRASAQDMPPRVEVGLHISSVSQPALHEKPLGGGGGMTYGVTRYVAIDAEASRYPIGDESLYPFTQALFGARAGIRLRNIGLFGKIRPGFASYDDNGYRPGIGTKLNLDLGGVLEIYSSRHVGARVDFGDTIIFFGSSPIGSPLGPKVLGNRSHFQTSVGLFVHF